MKDDACICFLQWALPHLHMRWSGFKKVRGQVCKRLNRRLEELQLADLKSYRIYLQDNPLEWHILDSMCRITISRFYRDKAIFDCLPSQVFPELIDRAVNQGSKIISCWCAGAASGEEPYTVSLLWDLSGFDKKGIELKILATDVDQQMINRARKGCYPTSSIRELPAEVTDLGFFKKATEFCIKEQYKKRVQFLQQDIRNEIPASTFHIIFCRNLVFTYFTRQLQNDIGQSISQSLKPGGALIIGAHEALPESLPGLVPWLDAKSIYRKED